jgi:hypothetical protein
MRLTRLKAWRPRGMKDSCDRRHANREHDRQEAVVDSRHSIQEAYRQEE